MSHESLAEQRRKLAELLDKNMGTHVDFPLKGIVFRDIFPVLYQPQLVALITDYFAAAIPAGARVDAVVGLDARGFLLGILLAQKLQTKFVPVRKAGKLPGQVHRSEYTKEYGMDVFEMQVEALGPGENVVLVDDLIATGGSLKCARELVNMSGATILTALTVMDIGICPDSEALAHSIIKT